MGKIVVEYKQHANSDGFGEIPSFIISGGWFENTVTKTVIGTVSDSFYIPSTLIRLTKSELIARYRLALVRPFEYAPCVDGNCAEDVVGKSLVDATDAIELWWAQEVDN